MKQRLDALLVTRGLCENRTRAQARIMAGEVYVNGKRVEKAGHPYPVDCLIHIKEDSNPYVSRGGLKVARALEDFRVSIQDRVCLDVGASTGGFTHCLLTMGARKVYALDVGKGQLHWQLRQDPRVICLEGINARYLSEQQLGQRVELVTIDVSFISLQLVLPAIKTVVESHADVLALVKPQFEAGRHHAERGSGVIREPAIHTDVLWKTVKFAARHGWKINGLTHSPLVGPKGNLEFWLWLKPCDETMQQQDWSRDCCEQVVRRAHAALGRKVHNI